MRIEIAIRSDGAVIVATDEKDGQLYGHIVLPDGTVREWPLPLVTLVARGEWERLPDADGLVLGPRKKAK